MYLRFLIDHRRLLIFGLLTALLSGFGQTFYIGLFNNELRATFGLTHGSLGAVYGVATLVSAIVLMFVGRLYDRVDIRYYLTGATVILAAGCALLAGTTALAGLLTALFLLRLGGQGLMGHIAMTTMARRFHGGRGKAVSIAALGFPLSEALFPLLALLLLAVMGWRGLWWLGAIVVPLLFLPLLLWLIRGATRGETLPADETRQRTGPDWRLGEVVRDPRFAMFLPAVLAAPFVVTIAFFHQVPMAESKGWSLELIATGLAIFALGHVIGLLLSGPLVDRWTAVRILVPALLPLIMSMGVLAIFDATWAALTWPGLLGITLGLVSTAGSALLAELYGITHLGAIRALLQALMIFATAIGPPLVGGLLDHMVSTEVIATGIALGVAMAGVLAWRALRGSRLYLET